MDVLNVQSHGVKPELLEVRRRCLNWLVQKRQWQPHRSTEYSSDDLQCLTLDATYMNSSKL